MLFLKIINTSRKSESQPWTEMCQALMDENWKNSQNTAGQS
jgi:hypothetical protein